MAQEQLNKELKTTNLSGEIAQQDSNPSWHRRLRSYDKLILVSIGLGLLTYTGLYPNRAPVDVQRYCQYHFKDTNAGEFEGNWVCEKQVNNVRIIVDRVDEAEVVYDQHGPFALARRRDPKNRFTLEGNGPLRQLYNDLFPSEGWTK